MIMLQVLIGHSGEKRCEKWKIRRANETALRVQLNMSLILFSLAVIFITKTVLNLKHSVY